MVQTTCGVGQMPFKGVFWWVFYSRQCHWLQIVAYFPSLFAYVKEKALTHGNGSCKSFISRLGQKRQEKSHSCQIDKSGL